MNRKLATILAAILVLTGLCAPALGAQGLLDNSYYKKSLELRALAASSFDEGDYDAAAGFAAQAGEYARLSDRYVETMLAKAAADKALAAAENKLAWAEKVGAAKNFAKEWTAGQESYAAARGAYQAEDYPLAAERAEAVLVAMQGVTEIVAPTWPASYVVRLIPERRDCLWRIAEYPFIYNDPLKWPVIYEANKKTFRDPNNPNLIFPGQVLQIPPVNGERREGTWDPKKGYEPFPKAAKK